MTVSSSAPSLSPRRPRSPVRCRPCSSFPPPPSTPICSSSNCSTRMAERSPSRARPIPTLRSPTAGCGLRTGRSTRSGPVPGSRITPTTAPSRSPRQGGRVGGRDRPLHRRPSRVPARVVGAGPRLRVPGSPRRVRRTVRLRHLGHRGMTHADPDDRPPEVFDAVVTLRPGITVLAAAPRDPARRSGLTWVERLDP